MYTNGKLEVSISIDRLAFCVFVLVKMDIYIYICNNFYFVSIIKKTIRECLQMEHFSQTMHSICVYFDRLLIRCIGVGVRDRDVQTMGPKCWAKI